MDDHAWFGRPLSWARGAGGERDRGAAVEGRAEPGDEVAGPCDDAHGTRGWGAAGAAGGGVVRAGGVAGATPGAAGGGAVPMVHSVGAARSCCAAFCAAAHGAETKTAFGTTMGLSALVAPAGAFLEGERFLAPPLCGGGGPAEASGGDGCSGVDGMRLRTCGSS